MDSSKSKRAGAGVEHESTPSGPNEIVLQRPWGPNTAGDIMNHRYRDLPAIDDEGRYPGIFGINSLLRPVLT